MWLTGHPDHELPDGAAPPGGRAAVRHPLLRSLQCPHQLQVGLFQLHLLWTEIYACYGLRYGYGLTHLLWIEIHLLWTAFDLVVYTVDCVTSRTLIQLLACGLVTCVLS